MGVYYVGACCCILERFPRLIQDASKICGASAGAVMAAIISVGIPIGELNVPSRLTKRHSQICQFNAALVISKLLG